MSSGLAQRFDERLLHYEITSTSTDDIKAQDLPDIEATELFPITDVLNPTPFPHTRLSSPLSQTKPLTLLDPMLSSIILAIQHLSKGFQKLDMVREIDSPAMTENFQFDITYQIACQGCDGKFSTKMLKRSTHLEPRPPDLRFSILNLCMNVVPHLISLIYVDLTLGHHQDLPQSYYNPSLITVLWSLICLKQTQSSMLHCSF
ncbi:hypothetical protein Sjap_000965 [Stephania japonica]|uniref:Uncharacterized protein n=1 Tax=Stephania japonica TaxID=461633 RepID=A0AAP0KK10_9MAGN